MEKCDSRLIIMESTDVTIFPTILKKLELDRIMKWPFEDTVTMSIRWPSLHLMRAVEVGNVFS